MEWELRITGHMERRLIKREFTEVELRRMMEHATGFDRDDIEGRWVIAVRLRRADWKIIVEPIPEEEILEIVTAYETTDD